MMKSAAAAEQISDSYELKYKGVRKRKWGKYVSEVRLPNSRDRIWLGSYDTAEKAARAFDAALFCLRGPYAKFNFPDDPPNIPGCQALTPVEIQVVAQHYGNTYGGSRSSRRQQLPPEAETEVGPRADEFEEASPSSNSIDWSFLDVLDSGMAGNSGHVSDFGLFYEPADMYVPPHLNEDYDNENENGGNNNAASFLWNY